MKWMLQILTLSCYRCGCPWFKKCGTRNEDEGVVTVGMKKEKEEESEEEDK